MGTVTSQITSLTIVYSTVYSDADQRKHQSSVSLAFIRGIHRGLVDSPHKWPATWKMFPFNDVIMHSDITWASLIISHTTFQQVVGSDNKGNFKTPPQLLAFCERKPQVTGGFPTQRASNAENVSIYWHHQCFIGMRQYQITQMPYVVLYAAKEKWSIVKGMSNCIENRNENTSICNVLFWYLCLMVGLDKWIQVNPV